MNLPRSPFVGLAAFTPHMAEYFTGRERFALTLAGAVLRSRITVLYGQSGCGKSSVLGAAFPQALRATLRRAAEAAGRTPFRLLNFWRWHPGFETRLVRAAAAKLASPKDTSLLDAVAGWSGTEKAPVILVLDQFEEFLLYNPDPTATEFVWHLASIIADPDLNAHILLSLREDSIASLDALRAVIPAVLSSPVQLRPLDRAAAEQAIRKPVEIWSSARFGDPKAVAIDDALVATLLDQVRQPGRSSLIADTANDPGTGSVELPLLQLSLDQLWRVEAAAVKPALRLQTLEALGGAPGIARQHLQTTMDALSVQQRTMAIRLFGHLVTPTGGKHAWRADDLAKELDAEAWATREATRRTKLGRVAGAMNAMTAWIGATFRKALQRSRVPSGIDQTTEAVTDTLSRLAEGRARILRTQPDLGGQGPLFELYHDSLAGPVLGWVQRARITEAEHRQRRRVLVVGLAALMALAGMVMWTLYTRAVIEGEAAHLQEARAISALARRETARGDATAGMLASLSVMPTAQNPRPFSVAAFMALFDAWLNHREIADMIGHAGAVNSASFSSDGMRVVTASSDETARVWDLTGPTPIATVLAGHTGPVWSASFSSDGKRVATASGDSTARVWDLTGPTPATELAGHYGVVSASFSSDDQRMVTASSSDNTARVWDLTGPSLVATVLAGHTGAVNSASFSPDGRRVVTASSDKTARVWDLTGPTPVATVLAGHTGAVTSASFSLDGKRVVTASSDNTARVWDLTGPTPVATVLAGHTDRVTSASFSPDGKRVVTASSDKTARVWDLTGPTPIATVLAGHTGAVISASFSPDGKRVVTASSDDTARVWDLTEPSPVATVLAGHTDSVLSASFSPDGNRVVTASSDKTARVWDLTGPTPVATVLAGHTGAVISASFSPDGKRVVTASDDNTARVWDLAGPIPVATVLAGHAGPVNSASFSPDGKRVVTASDDNTARVWDLTGPTPVATVLADHTDRVRSASFSPDGRHVVTASSDKTARVWDLTEPTPVATVLVADPKYKGPVDSASFSSDGKRVVTSSDKIAWVWDLTGPTPIATMLKVNAAVNSASFSSDGKRVVTASDDNTARVWDLTGPTPAATMLAGHTGAVNSASFSPDGKRVVTASSDKSARVWDLTGPTPVATVLAGHTDSVLSASFSPDGRRVVTASDDNTARVWDLTGPTPVATVLAGHTGGVLSASFSSDGKRVVTASDDNTALVQPTPSVADLMTLARQSLTRCLTIAQREAFGLPVEGTHDADRNVIHEPPCSAAGPGEAR
jgi:WD40 repeat protein